MDSDYREYKSIYQAEKANARVEYLLGLRREYEAAYFAPGTVIRATVATVEADPWEIVALWSGQGNTDKWVVSGNDESFTMDEFIDYMISGVPTPVSGVKVL